MKKAALVLALASLTLFAAAAASLKVGSKAPGLSVSKWVKGEPVKKFAPGTVYVIEFWATWCGPCIREIPHLTEVQKKYPEVVVIGVAASERKPKSGGDDRLKKVEKFVADKGAEMDYRVAFDPDSSMQMGWMSAAGQRGIPCTFIVDGTGKIGWIGHPQTMDAPLEAIVKATAKSVPKGSDSDGDADNAPPKGGSKREG